MNRSGGRLAIGLLIAALLLAPPATAQRSGQHVPGDFDFYVLSLSWSPSFCEAEAGGAERLQCHSGRPYAFIIHGLWPQYERGWPEFCPALPSRAPEQVVRGMLDVMPSEALVRHQWEKHGTCSGLSPEGYFGATRTARDRVVVPPQFAGLDRQVSLPPEEVERAFIAANPSLPPDGIAVTCDRNRLREVRICMSRAFAFRSCPRVSARACSLGRVAVPPVAGR